MAFALLLGTAPYAMAQPASIEIYGFAMLDMGINLNTIDPNWFDTMRLNKLPSFDGRVWRGRQSRSPEYARAGWA